MMPRTRADWLTLAAVACIALIVAWVIWQGGGR